MTPGCHVQYLLAELGVGSSMMSSVPCIGPHGADKVLELSVTLGSWAAHFYRSSK